MRAANLSKLLSFAICLLVLSAWSSAEAGTITTDLSPFTGDPASVTVELDDMTDPGNIVITLTVNEDPNTADLRGFFFDIADDSLLAGLTITGAEVTETAISANSVINLGGGNNLNGGGSPCPCDVGVEIGNPGIGQGDDFQTTTFTLSHLTEGLDLSVFAGQDLGVRVMSVGLPGSSRNGSSKLFGTVPEPSTGALVGLALIAGMRRRKRLA